MGKEAKQNLILSGDIAMVTSIELFKFQKLDITVIITIYTKHWQLHH